MIAPVRPPEDVLTPRGALRSAAILLVVVLALLSAHPGWLGPNPRATIFSAQALVIAAFIAFTCNNWRCPACRRYLGGDLHRQACGKCRARLR